MLTAVVALDDRSRLDRLGARWLARWLDETPAPTLEGAKLVVTLLETLGTPRHDWAVAALHELAGSYKPYGAAPTRKLSAVCPVRAPGPEASGATATSRRSSTSGPSAGGARASKTVAVAASLFIEMLTRG